MSNIVQILKSIGFTDGETHTYLASLESGPATVIDLTKLTDLSRQTTYMAIERLIERGLMTSVERNGKNIFAAEPAEKLVTYAKRYEQDIRERLNDLAQLIPELDLMSGGSRPIVKMYEGKEAVLAVMQELKESDTPVVHELADIESLHAVLAPEQFQPLRERAEKSLRVYGLYRVPESQILKNADAIRLPLHTDPFHANISIFGNQAVLASYEGKMHAVIIESKAIADALRILFKISADSLTRTSES